jgi:ADP-ribose pyrophosphatase YjhB (NUDIX family)
MNTENKIGVKCRAVILHEGRLLAVKHPENTSVAILPGGILEHGEDPKECMKREIKEELGVDAEIGRLLYINTFTRKKDNIHFVEFFFEILNTKDFLEKPLVEPSHAHEIADVVWLNREDCDTLVPKNFAEEFKNNRVISDTPRFIK